MSKLTDVSLLHAIDERIDERLHKVKADAVADTVTAVLHEIQTAIDRAGEIPGETAYLALDRLRDRLRHLSHWAFEAGGGRRNGREVD
jgi:hypothetical protein